MVSRLLLQHSCWPAASWWTSRCNAGERCFGTWIQRELDRACGAWRRPRFGWLLFALGFAAGGGFTSGLAASGIVSVGTVVLVLGWVPR
jgi:hypothetical protein